MQQNFTHKVCSRLFLTTLVVPAVTLSPVCIGVCPVTRVAAEAGPITGKSVECGVLHEWGRTA